MPSSEVVVAGAGVVATPPPAAPPTVIDPFMPRSRWPSIGQNISYVPPFANVYSRVVLAPGWICAASASSAPPVDSIFRLWVVWPSFVISNAYLPGFGTVIEVGLREYSISEIWIVWRTPSLPAAALLLSEPFALPLVLPLLLPPQAARARVRGRRRRRLRTPDLRG